MKKFSFVFILILVACVLFGCTSTADKEAMTADLSAYSAFLDSMAAADTTDLSAYAMSVNTAVEEFDCSTKEALALKADYETLAEELTTLAVDVKAAQEAAASDGGEVSEVTESASAILAQFEGRLDEIKTQAADHEQALKEKADDMGLLEEYNSAVSMQ